MIYILLSQTYKYLPVAFIIFLFISIISPNFSIPRTQNQTLLQVANFQKDSLREITFVNIDELLYNAKEIQDTARIISIYNQLVEKSSDREKLYYLDSILSYSKPFKDTNNTYNAYFDQALLYLKMYSYKKALNAILNAYAIARDDDGEFQQMSALLVLAHINTIWNNNAVSLAIYSKIDALKSKTDKNEDENLNLVIALGLTTVHLQNKNPDSALVYINTILKGQKDISTTLFYDSYLWSTGVAYFQKNEYRRGLDSMHKASSISLSNYYTVMVNYYEAKYSAVIGNEEQAIDYYLKMDTLVTIDKLVFPEMKEVYTEINDYYLEKEDYNNQFLYLNKLINAINTQADITNYIARTTRDFYEMPELLQAKQVQIEELRRNEVKNRIAAIIVGSLFLIILIILSLYTHKQRNYKRRFKKLMSEKNAENLIAQDEIQNTTISLEVINDLMQKLQTFEDNKDFTNRDISLNEVSKQFHTNSTYLSKVINLKKDKNFSNYINDLRIEYCIELLNSNEKLRNYTIKALAEEVGFNNPQSFSNAFFKYAGIYPSFFIGELNKIKK